MVKSTPLNLATDESNQSYMARSKRMTKNDYIKQLLEFVEFKANKLTVKELKSLIAKHALS